MTDEAAFHELLGQLEPCDRFYPSSSGCEATSPRPDGLYGVTNVFGEALARMHSDRFGIEAICVRIGWFSERPLDPRQLPSWLSPADTVRLFRACLSARDVDFLTVYGVSANSRS
ncbi:MAG: NAD(P)-dependent oxidoreductase [Thermoleophilaceae bacterium]|nr:NAD(P)-dependent oxidoreductase [Thermoleophilaceae bacterium]